MQCRTCGGPSTLVIHTYRTMAIAHPSLARVEIRRKAEKTESTAMRIVRVQ